MSADPFLAATVRRAQRGDVEAHSMLVRRFQDMAVGYARSVLGDAHLAEDAAQDAFVQMLDDLPSLRQPTAIAGWLRRLVFKHCDRQTRRASLPTTPLPEEGIMDVDRSDPLQDLERQQEREVVQRSIEALPEPQREAVTLYYMSQHSQA